MGPPKGGARAAPEAAPRVSHPAPIAFPLGSALFTATTSFVCSGVVNLPLIPAYHPLGSAEPGVGASREWVCCLFLDGSLGWVLEIVFASAERPGAEHTRGGH